MMMRQGMFAEHDRAPAPRRRGMFAEPEDVLPEEDEEYEAASASMHRGLFSEPQKVPLPQDELSRQYRVKNTFIDSFEDEEEDMPKEFGMKSCPAGIWKNAFMAYGDVGSGAQQPFVKAPMKVALDSASPLAATHGGGRSPALSPAPPGLHLGAPSLAQETSRSPGPPGLLAPPQAQSGGPGRPRSPVAPGQWNGPVPQVKLGQPSVVNMPWRTIAEASPSALSASPRKSTVPARATSYSQGSALHDAGGCEPCAWFWKPAGCRNAADCKRCHLCEEGALKNRKKVKVMMMRTKSGAEAEEGCVSTSATDGVASEEPAPAPARAPRLPMQLQGAPSVEPQVQPQAGDIFAALLDDALKDEEDSDDDAEVDAAEPTAPVEQQMQLNFGSRLHMIGECEPCAWFWRPTGCSHGQECRRCHLCPEGEVKARKKKKLALLRRNREEGVAGEVSILFDTVGEEAD